MTLSPISKLWSASLSEPVWSLCYSSECFRYRFLGSDNRWVISLRWHKEYNFHSNYSLMTVYFPDHGEVEYLQKEMEDQYSNFKLKV